MKKPNRETLKDLIAIHGSEEQALIAWREAQRSFRKWDKESDQHIKELKNGRSS